MLQLRGLAVYMEFNNSIKGNCDMTLDEYLEIIGQYTEFYDRSAAIRSYRAYYKGHNEFVENEVRQYVRSLLPGDDLVSIQAILESVFSAGVDIGKAVKWFEQKQEIVTETLCGWYVSKNAAKKLYEFLIYANPVRNEFNRFCVEVGREPTHAMFADYRRYMGRQLLQTRYHPASDDQYFWMESVEQLGKTFESWYMVYTAYDSSDMDGNLSLADCADVLGIHVKKLLVWLCKNESAYTLHQGRCFVPISTAYALKERWKHVQLVLLLLEEKLVKIPCKAKKTVKNIVLSQLEQMKPFWILADGTLPQQLEGKLYTAQTENANLALDKILDAIAVWPINRLQDITGMATKHLKKWTTNNIIEATRDDSGNYYVSADECRRVKALQERYISLDMIVANGIQGDNCEFHIGVHTNRDSLIDFCNEYDWWGIDYLCSKDLPINGGLFEIVVAREDSAQLQVFLQPWLRGYRKSYAEKFAIITESYKAQYPHVVKNLIQYEKEKHTADKPLIDMMQMLFWLIDKEINEMGDVEIEHVLIEPFSKDASLASCNLLSEYLLFSGYSKRNFQFVQGGKKMDTTAYAVSDFAVMVCHVVNEGVIKEHNLVQKALSSKKYADLWLYIALHIFASWRSTDYIRMKEPQLPCGPKELMEKIERNELLPEQARNIAEYFMAVNRLALNVPHKTKGTSGVPRLYFYCPRSCMESFGVILGIATAHYYLTQKADTFVTPVRDWFTIKQFFGEEFLKACGNRSFSGRRANKALMQSIDFVGREDGDLPPLVAYHLASLMRSHKLSYGKLSETTDIYLKDANFSGCTPEFIAYQMWERGVCSFVVDVMMKNCYGEQYSLLSVPQQTKLITSVGLTPYQTTNILRYVQKAEDDANEIIRAVSQDKETIRKATKRIALGHGLGKNPDCYCLRKAAGYDCEFKNRLNCMGCRYEIRTKALLVHYAQMHKNLTHFEDATGELERKRRVYLCKEVTYPAMQEIVLHLSEQPGEEYEIYKKLVQEVMTSGITECSTS